MNNNNIADKTSILEYEDISEPKTYFIQMSKQTLVEHKTEKKTALIYYKVYLIFIKILAIFIYYYLAFQLFRIDDVMVKENKSK